MSDRDGRERRKHPRTAAVLSTKSAGTAVPAAALYTSLRAEDGKGGRVVSIGGQERRLNARPDPLDFRDRMYEATLIEVLPRSNVEAYRDLRIPVLDQGAEGSCTGAALATVAHYLLRTRSLSPDSANVSIRMFYEMAKRYDEWEGTDYSGSSARGAMKGWHKHGVCAHDSWPYESNVTDRLLTTKRAQDAAARPLGAYLRVDHTDLVAMHAAISEVGILYVTARIHEGWERVGADGQIPFEEGFRELGGHAFVIVGYDSDGLWVQNSWGTDWAANGLARMSYDDWLANATDVWVARLGAPVALSTAAARAMLQIKASGTAEAYSLDDLRPHVISVGNDGELRRGGRFGMTSEGVDEIFKTDFPRLTKNWSKKRILLYAHGGLVAEEGALQRVADYREALLQHEVYPLAFIWKTDYWTTLRNMLRDASAKRRPEGTVTGVKDFLLDRADDMLEPLARVATGKAEWDEMKENALRASVSQDGAARLVLRHLKKLASTGVEIHVVGHSAGSIFHAPIVQMLTTPGTIQADLGGFRETLRGEKGFGIPIKTCTLWAPACTTRLFHDAYAPAIASGAIEDFAVFTLTDRAENDDDCAKIYNKSLLFLVSNAFEERFRIPLLRPDGEPILGMERFVRKDAAIKALGNRFQHILSPNTHPAGSPKASTATTHGGFDDDNSTVRATLARVVGTKVAAVSLPASAQARRSQRQMLLA
jgi:hypothetical protein